MAQLVTAAVPPYALPVPKDKRTGDGPWGEAIQYWLKEKQLRQAHIVEATGMDPNKVSRAANGFTVRWDALKQIAEFLDVPFESVLVSPLRRLGPAEERRVADQVAVIATRLMTERRPQSPNRPLDPRLFAVARRIGKLAAGKQKEIVDMVTQYEKQARRDKAAGRNPRKP